MEVVIVGGGIAGLACLNALLDKGISALLVEGGTIGSIKLCGEFLSPYAKEALEAWKIGPIQSIENIHIDNLRLQIPAGAISRSIAEVELAKRATSLGGEIMQETKVVDVSPASLLLADGRRLLPNKLVIASGKLTSHQKEFPYIGLKAHIEHSDFQPTLEMHVFPGGYFGKVPISATISNVACLMKKDATLPPLDLTWHKAPVPHFGCKVLPRWQKSFFIGDAAATFPPATGQGFAHAIFSGKLAARYIANDDEGFQDVYMRILAPKMRAALAIHSLILSPFCTKVASSALSLLPKKTLTRFVMIEGN